MDVETLMQEIKQWDPRDQAQKPAPSASMEAAESHTPSNMSFADAQEPAASPSLTPDHSQEDDKASFSSDKVCTSGLSTLNVPAVTAAERT